MSEQLFECITSLFKTHTCKERNKMNGCSPLTHIRKQGAECSFKCEGLPLGLLQWEVVVAV